MSTISRRELLSKDTDEIMHSFTRPRHSRAVYYWIYVPGTRPLVGYKSTEDEAYSYGYSKLEDRHFEVIPLSTIDRARATALIKGRELDRTRRLENSLRPIHHKDKEDI